MNSDTNISSYCNTLLPAAFSTGMCAGPQWTIAQADDNFCTFLQQEASAVIGKSFLEILHRLGHSNTAASIAASVPDGTITFTINNIFYSLAWRELPASADQQAPLRFVVCQEIPISTSVAARELLWRQLTVILDSIHDGIWMIDGDGITVYVNKAVSRITGIEASEVLGKHVTAPMQEGKYHTCVTLRALKEKKAVTMFDDYPAGKRCLNTSIPIFDDNGKIWRVLASIRDMPELEDLQIKLAEAENDALRGKGRKGGTEKEQPDIIGNSPLMQKCINELEKAAKAPSTVLILGETGTGKTLAASYIHQKSVRADKPFITINCAAIPASLIEAELFGYEKGAFTGASQEGKKGLLELADKGTIFLDEIGDLPLSMQVKLLHVLDNFSFRRVGGVKNVQVNVRIMAATNRPLEELVKQGDFRADLYYRLRVLSTNLPPLRERSEDIAPMALHFLDDACKKHGIIKFFDPQVLQALSTHLWPGNVRELRATVEFMAAMTEGKIIKLRDLPSHIMGAQLGDTPPAHTEDLPQKLKTAVQNLEYIMIKDALTQAGSTYKAAALLGVSQSTIVRKAQQLHIHMPD